MNIKYPRDSKILHPKNTKKTVKTDAENYKKTTEMQLNLDELQTKLNGLNQTVDAVSQSTQNLDDALTQISTNTAGISTLNQSVSTLQNTVGTNTQNISALQTTVGVHTQNVNALQNSKQDVLTAGNNITIDANNVISATDTTYTAGQNVTILNGEISATDTTYTAGTGISIANGVISATSSGGLSSVTASDVDSESATSGQVLTADGQGGAGWQTASGLTQEQSNKLDVTYDYFITHVVQPDPVYNPQTPSDYPAGTIFKTYDCYERVYNLYSTSTITVPTIYFCAEAESSADFYYEINLESRTADTDAIINFYVNGNLISTDNVSLLSSVNVNFRKNIYGISLATNTKANNLYFTIAQSGSSTIAVTYQKVQISAPNADIFNKISPYCVEYIGNQYYVTDCSDGNAKLAVINVENMYNISNLQFTNLGFEAQYLDIGRNMITYSNNTAEYDDTVYAYLTKQNKVIYKLLSNGKTYTNSTLCNFDWMIYRGNSAYFTGIYDLNNPLFVRIAPNLSKASTGVLSTKYNDIVSEYAVKFLSNDVPVYIPNYIYTQIRSNGNVYLGLYNNNTDACNINLGYGTKARACFTNIVNYNTFSVAVFVKRYDKIVRYDCSISNTTQGYTINSVTEIGSYDDFYLGADNDYFVIKNNSIEYHKFPTN